MSNPTEKNGCEFGRHNAAVESMAHSLRNVGGRELSDLNRGHFSEFSRKTGDIPISIVNIIEISNVLA